MKTTFSRVVLCRKCWANTPDGPVFATAYFSLSEVGEVFGPPDGNRRIAEWAFVDRAGNVSCSIIAHTGNMKPAAPVQMDFVAPAKIGRAFFDWATEKINLTQNGELPPAFLVAEH